MSVETRDIGMDWAIERLRALAHQANLPLETVYWDAEVDNTEAQTLVAGTPGKEKKWEIANLDLEDEQRRSQLEQILQAVVASLS
jgi:hypothetical protein